MDLENVSQLVVPRTPPVEHRNRIEGPEKETEFLSLRLLNKRGRVRLSPTGIDYGRLPGRSSLLAVGNTKGWFAAAVRKEDSSNHILFSTLGDLHTAFESSHIDREPFIPFTPGRPLLSVPGTPNIIKFALNDEVLLVGFLEGPILVYSSKDLTHTGGPPPNPVHVFPGDASTVPRDILPNPGENPELVAIMRGVHGQEPGHQIDVVDIQHFKHIAGWRKGEDPSAAPVSISWSPKGKQIAIGLISGDMLLYSPLSPGNPKSHLLKPPSAPPDAPSLLATTWLSTPTFYTVFSSPEASSTLFDPSTSDPPTSIHFISTHDSKSRSATDVELRDPCPPFGAKRPPGPLSVVLRNWSPTKFIIFCGDGTSADIGVIGTFPNSSDPQEDGWGSFNLEETSTPSLPLDEEMNDTALLGLEIDLTSSKPVRISEQPDDGTPDLPPSPILYAYASDGSVVAWHVLNSNGQAYPCMTTVSGDIASQSALSITQPQESVQALGMPSPRVSPPSTPAPSHRPEQAFGSPTSSAAFGQGTTHSPAATPAPAPGFGAFGSTTTSKFGSTGFGFGKSPANSAFGSTSFGGGGSLQGDQAKPAQSPAFGTTGFGQASALSGFGSKSAAPAFGQSGFGAPSKEAAKPVSAFGTSSGGFASFAGQGTSTFGAPEAAKPVSAFGTSSGGFASFASQGTSTFGAPVNMSSTSISTPPPTSVFGQQAFAQTALPSVPVSAFGSGGQGQASSPPSTFVAGGMGQVSPGQASETSAHSPSPSRQQPQPTPAFGAFGQQAGTPAFGKSGFGNTTTAPSSHGGSFGAFGTLGDALQTKSSSALLDSPPGSPPSPDESPSGSPELRPSSRPTESTPTSSKPSGSFGSFVKPAEGFGAFANAVKSSPFLRPAEGFGLSSHQKSAVSAFTRQDSAAPAIASTSVGSSGSSSTTPTFGSTSALGRKPLFGTSSFGSGPQLVAEPSKPISGGFSAYTSGGGGFASFVKDVKSVFSEDILGSGEKDKPKPDATPFASSSAPVSNALAAPAFGISNEGKLSSATVADKSADVLPTRVVGVKKADSVQGGEASEKQFSDGEYARHGPSASPAKDEAPSFNLLSIGETTPRDAPPLTTLPADALPAEASDSRSGPQSVDEKQESAEDAEESGSEPFSLTDDDESNSEERYPRSPTRSLSEEEVEEESHDVFPQTPQDRTPRSTSASLPATSVNTPEVSVSSPLPESFHSTSIVGEREESTTPPGSPGHTIALAHPSAATPVAPKPVLPSSTASSFGLGIGRPSSRPIRSSPLASAPITSADTEDSTRDLISSKSAPVIATANLLERMTPLTTVSSTAPASPADGPSHARPRRPKTPPLLGASSSTPGAKPVMESPISLGQPLVTPVPLHPPIPPAQSAITTPIPNVSSQQAREDEDEHPIHPMQLEFLRAYQETMKELVQLHKKAQEMAMIRPIIAKPRGLDNLVLNNQDFVPGKYSLGDLQAFATMISILQRKVVPLLEQGNANKRILRDLQHLALISETKQEELYRWVRAREDPEFAKTIKPRTLGPEHSENQIRLRKTVQMTSDRIQQCEDQVEALKRRLDLHKSGKVGFRPPTLDTIDRTCRNIKLALDERTKLLDEMHDRIEALSPRASQKLQSSHGFLGSSIASPASVTPPFASVAAAALNSERSSLRLKDALLATRKEPLFTTKIAKLEPLKPVSRSSQVSTQGHRPEWKLPPVPPLGSPSSPLSRRTGRTEKKHGAVPLKTSATGAGAKPVAFDWGPLPRTAPMHQLSGDVRSQKGRSTSGFTKQDDSEWDQEAHDDYKPHQ